jgi:hypothetical protein
VSLWKGSSRPPPGGGVRGLLGPFDLLLDGTDNFETRFLIRILR